MFWLGHLGIGLATAKTVDRNPPLKPLFLGTLLPDLIDKSLYYGHSWATDRSGAALGLISGTRTFGHTALLAAAVYAMGTVRKSRAATALSLGMATHLLLDIVTDLCIHGHVSPKAFAWPLFGWGFPVYAFTGWHEHASTLRHPFMITAEALGALLLFVEWRRRRPRV